MATGTSTRVQICNQITYAQDGIVSDKNQPYTTEVPYGVSELPWGVNLYARGQHGSSISGLSNWSETINFRIAPPEDVVGICLYGAGNRMGDFRRIDASGNFLSSFNYLACPLYTQKMRNVTIDGCEMKEFDTLYVKTATSGPLNSDSAMRPCWWLSGTNYVGFTPASAFLRDGGVKQKIWLSRYMGHSTTIRGRITMGSAANTQPEVGRPRDEYKLMIANHNAVTAGVTGFRMIDIWDMSLLKLVLLIFGGGTDVQSIWGDNSAGITNPITGSTGANALGIHDLWRTHWCMTEGISILNKVIKLKSPYDDSTINTERMVPGQSGWIYDIHEGDFRVGNTDHTYLELFLPRTTMGLSTDGTYADYYHAQVNGDMSSCGSAGSGSTMKRTYWNGYGTACANRVIKPELTETIPATGSSVHWGCGTGSRYVGRLYINGQVINGVRHSMIITKYTRTLDGTESETTAFTSNNPEGTTWPTTETYRELNTFFHDKIATLPCSYVFTEATASNPIAEANCVGSRGLVCSKQYSPNQKVEYTHPEYTACTLYTTPGLPYTNYMCKNESCPFTYTYSDKTALSAECGIFTMTSSEVNAYTATRLAKS